MGGLSVSGVGMAYGPRALFADVTVSLVAGETLLVTGRNGTGKSTLLKIIAGLLRPEEGTIRRVGVCGYAAPDMNLYAELTAAENLAFFAGLRGVLPHASDLLDRVGLPSRRAADLVGTYSSGMRQRLKLALSLLGDPALLVWDEPTLALDAAGGACVEEILQRHSAAGGMAVIATNDAVEAERWGHNGLRLHLGHA